MVGGGDVDCDVDLAVTQWNSVVIQQWICQPFKSMAAVWAESSGQHIAKAKSCGLEG